MLEYPVHDSESNGVEQRSIFGITKSDIWSFDSFLLVVLANGLQLMHEDKMGVPNSYVTDENDIDAARAAWDKDLLEAKEHAVWLFNRDEFFSNAHDKIFGDETHFKFESIPGSDHKLMVSTATKEQDDAFHEASRELEAEAEERKNKLLDFIKKNFFSLWT